MPKILINEVDSTSAGTPGRYGNYTVLLAGYKGTPATDTNKWQKPDENGVYEFSSAQAFKDTIGLTDSDSVHAGNRMAYELLNLGYQVIYRVVDTVNEMAGEGFWEIFKDKASYDFRFVSHGLLKTDFDTIKAEYDAKQARLEAIDESLNILVDIYAKAEEDYEKADPKPAGTKELAILTACDKYFAAATAESGEGFTTSDGKVIKNYKFLDNAGTAYSSYALAAGIDLTGDGEPDCSTVTEYIKQTADGTDNPDYKFTECLFHDRITVKNDIAKYDNEYFTIGVFNKINGNIANLASYRANDDGLDMPPYCAGRGDCLALIELDENTYVCESKLRPEELIINGIKGMAAYIGGEGAYCALTVPSVHYYVDGKVTKKMPASFHYLACFINSLNSGFAEWYAVAGYNRGVSSYVIDHTSVKLGEIAINALEPRNIENQKTQPPFACNVIANFRGSYYLWGNRTAAKLGEKAGGDDLTAEHFLNIRQLCATIKKQLYVSCRRFTFDPNSDTLWFNFVNSITPTLDAMKADQGIRDYKVVKVFTDKKATLKARIRIIPIEAVEDFEITVALEDSFGGVSVTAEG